MEQKEDGDKEWTMLRSPWDDEMRWEPFQYFPEAHFRKAYDEVRKEHWPDVRTDGGYADLHSGKRKASVYYWLDPDTGAALYHTGVNDEETIPFFRDEGSAMDYLEKRVEGGDKEQYKGLSLYKARTQKVGDAVDVLTDQAGLVDFVPDGGVQIDNPAPDRVWFWYDPAADYIVQEEIEPYDVRGVFESEDDAYRFLDWYAELYSTDLPSPYLELYSAELQYEGTSETARAKGPDSVEEPSEQVDFNLFRKHRSMDPGEGG